VNFDPQYEYRTGIGTDIHRLVPDRPLFLGGVLVPFELGLLAHSDGDVVIHAVIDSLLGATAMGDIGTIFPDNDPAYKNIDSKHLLSLVHEKIEEGKWQIINIDIVITAEQPKLGQYKGQMKRSIASLLGMDFANVNVKAKTNEGMGEIGRGEAISAMAIALLRKRIKRTL
jgi:2-C-methyl-D-erythritol 2,4-cyclodiphosphate synthase